MGRGAMSIADYFTEMLDPSLNWDDVAEMVQRVGRPVLPQGRDVAPRMPKRAVDIGCTGVVVSNHGGRQLDGSRTSFDQLAEIVDAVGDRLDVLMDGGVQRGTHVLKALSLGAKAVGVGRYYLFPLAAAGQAGVERALELMRHRDRARHEADGLHLDRAAVAVESQIPQLESARKPRQCGSGLGNHSHSRQGTIARESCHPSKSMVCDGLCRALRAANSPKDRWETIDFYG